MGWTWWVSMARVSRPSAGGRRRGDAMTRPAAGRYDVAPPTRRGTMFNRSFLIVLVIALAAGLGLVASQKWFGGEPASVGPELATVRLFPQARELPPFALQQSDGT